jgi:hypothetical protein
MKPKKISLARCCAYDRLDKETKSAFEGITAETVEKLKNKVSLFTILTKEEVEAKRCSAYQYVV